MTREYYQKHREQILQKEKERYQKQRTKKLAYAKQYAETHKEKIKEYRRQWAKGNQKAKKRKQQWVVENREKLRERHRLWARKQRQTNPVFKLKQNLRHRVYSALKGNGRKSDHTLNLVGCTIDQLKQHLQSLWKPNMTWDNYGQWHVDHMRPCSSFDLSKESEQKKCFHYTNLQPLCAIDNLIKNASCTQY